MLREVGGLRSEDDHGAEKGGEQGREEMEEEESRCENFPIGVEARVRILSRVLASWRVAGPPLYFTEPRYIFAICSLSARYSYWHISLMPLTGSLARSAILPALRLLALLLVSNQLHVIMHKYNGGEGVLIMAVYDSLTIAFQLNS